MTQHRQEFISLAIGLGELRVPPLKFTFQANAVAHVADKTPRVNEFAFFPKNAGMDQNLFDRPVLASQRRWEIVDDLPLREPAPELLKDLRPFKQRGERTADIFLSAVT